MYASDGLRAYRRARTAFSAKVYGLLILWLVLALIQWMVVGLVEDIRTNFRKIYFISLLAFALAVILLAIFIFANGLRFMQFLNFIITLVIVELQIIATCLLVVYSWWADLLLFFAVCVALVFIFLAIGTILPRRIDFTLDIAVLFIIAFIFLIIAIFALALLMCLWFSKMYTYLVVELAVTITILLFVIYHAQTIHGNRFAEMLLNDFFLGSLILFHDFLIIFWLTFYWQIQYRPITPNSWVASSPGSPNAPTAAMSTAGGKPDVPKESGPDSSYDFDNEDKSTDGEKQDMVEPTDIDDEDKDAEAEKPNDPPATDEELDSYYDIQDENDNDERKKRDLVLPHDIQPAPIYNKSST